MKYAHQSTDPWTWAVAGHADIEDILDLVAQNYEHEIDGILTASRPRMCYHLHRAILEQTFEPERQLVSIARDKESLKLLAWAWLERGKYTVYAAEEMAVAEFLHVDLTLSARTRITLCAQVLLQWIAACEACNIPVLCSTTIRDDQQAFIRLHDRLGFKVRGSFAYLKVTKPVVLGAIQPPI